MKYLPTLSELKNPKTQPEAIREKLQTTTDPLDPINIFNIHWYGENGELSYRILPKELTGVDAEIAVLCGYRFPTGSHKVGPVYSSVREYLVRGELDESEITLVFPSTGNFGIGGAWVGPRMGFRSLVVLPEEMSEERFEKIRSYGAEIIATPGCESNVKEIYDKVKELRQNPNNKIINQFEEFGNYRFHYWVTGSAAEDLAQTLEKKGTGKGRISAFVSAMGSAGTIAAGDYLRTLFPECKIVGVEPKQCPTLYNVGYGGHAIEGIGDKHVTWIHNVRNMDLLLCIDDYVCLEGLQLLQEGREFLSGLIDDQTLNSWEGVFGISGVCNILAAIETARYWEMGPDDLIVTIATDGFDRYPSVMRRLEAKVGPQTKEVALRRLEYFRKGCNPWFLEGTMETKRRWHNQKYFTWVEQQGKSIEELNALWSPSFWRDQAALIEEFDRETIKLRGY